MDEVPRPSHLPPGYDGVDPYGDEDLTAYPEWWRENIELFEEHGMRAYRPSRFSDGELVPPFVRDLEAELGVEIRVRAIDPDDDAAWDLVVADRVVAEVERHRESDGFTRYHIDSDEFESIVRAAARDGGSTPCSSVE